MVLCCLFVLLPILELCLAKHIMILCQTQALGSLRMSQADIEGKACAPWHSATQLEAIVDSCTKPVKQVGACIRRETKTRKSEIRGTQP